LVELHHLHALVVLVSEKCPRDAAVERCQLGGCSGKRLTGPFPDLPDLEALGASHEGCLDQVDSRHVRDPQHAEEHVR
jgi:hypothetical protein